MKVRRYDNLAAKEPAALAIAGGKKPRCLGDLLVRCFSPSLNKQAYGKVSSLSRYYEGIDQTPLRLRGNSREWGGRSLKYKFR